ncbi:MAG: glucokinase [Cyanobacteriota bacterium]|jgi:glucokinase
MTTLLAGDIGGTKTLLALYALQDDGLEVLASERFVSSEWSDLAPMVQRFLASQGPGEGTVDWPQAACLAVAGPVRAGSASLTNLPWRLQDSELGAATRIRHLELVNDFAVLVYGLPHLQEHQRACLRPGTADPAAPMLILGAGTGLGVAIGVAGAAGLEAIASEAGHGEFAARSDSEWRLRQWLLADLQLERLSIERVVSGTGLGHLARWLLHEHHPAGDHPLQRPGIDDLPAAVAGAAAEGDALARRALDLWLGAYGSVAGDLALATLSRGGVWLAGGTAGKLLAELRGGPFLEAFGAKGRLAPVLDPLPITAITDPAIGLFSAACRARMLLASAPMGAPMGARMGD